MQKWGCAVGDCSEKGAHAADKRHVFHGMNDLEEEKSLKQGTLKGPRDGQELEMKLQFK